MNIKKVFGAVALLLMSLIVSGCGGGGGGSTTATPLGDLVSINVTPASSTVIEGLGVQLTANGSYSGGQTVDISTSVNWVSSDTTIATVNASGLSTAVAAGTVTITATTTGSDGITEISGTADLTVNAASLTSISVTPASATVVEGLPQAFVATGNYDNGSSVDLSSSAIWSSSDVTIATVDASGLSTGVAAGTATITATSGLISGSASLTVNVASLTSISVTPSTASVVEGSTQTFVATGNYDDGSSADISTSVSWTSSNNAIATVSASGLAAGVSQGSATITATGGLISGSASLTVNAASLTSISVTPSTASVVEGSTQTFVATGNYDNGSSADISSSVTWTSSNVTVATVDGSGLSTGVAAGVATITATSGGVSATADLTVNAATLTSISVTPAIGTVIEGMTQAFVATGNYDNGSSTDISASVNWTSNNVTIATVDASGLATGVSQGSATVTATSGFISGSASLTVNAATLTSISVTPANATVIEGLTQAFVATGNYDNGSSADLSASVNWTSSNNAIATVGASGLAAGVSQGSATITATSGFISGSASLTVNAATLTSISVTPANATVLEGLTQTFVATGNYDNGSSADISASVIWTSSNVTVATVDASGLSTGVAAGTASITATSGFISGSASLTVNAAILTSISVTPATAAVLEGMTQAFVATGNYDNGSSVDISTSVTWASSNVYIATVNASGLSTGVAPGVATITATNGSISGSADLTVNAASVIAITVTPATAAVLEGQTQAFAATASFDNGSSADLSASIYWTSSDVTIATVNDLGVATGVAPGTATITWTNGTISDSASLTVNAATLTSISVTPATATVLEGLTQAFVATGNYDNGNSVDISASVNWTSSDVNIATVNASGLSTGVSQGSATITATSGFISGSTSLTVNAATLTSISVSPATATVVEGLTQTFVAMGNYDNGSSADISTSVNWTSSNVLIATVDASGLSTGVAAGIATITATSGVVSGTAELTVELAPSVNDTFSINVNGTGDTVYTETANGTVPGGFDPFVYVQLDQTISPAALTAITLVKNFDTASSTWGQTHLLTYVGDTASTLTFASGSANAIFMDTQMEMGDNGTYAPGSIAVSSYGAEGELVVGSYDVSLCEFGDLFSNACGLGSTNYTGSFSAVREPNAGSNQRPKGLTLGDSQVNHVSDLHGGINVYQVDVVAGTEYVIDVTGLSADVLLVEYNNDAGTYLSGTPDCISNNAGTTNESCTVTALGTKLYFTIGGSEANYTVTVSEPVVGGLPDLSIAIDSATSPIPGFLQISYTMTNNGPADLINADLVLGGFINPVTTPVVGDAADATSPLTAVNIASGATYTGSILIPITGTSAALYLTVDHNGVINEANESNNVSAVFIWSSAGPVLADEGTTATPVIVDAAVGDLPYSGMVNAGSSYYE
ncbi:MAG: Ig-like domain-containing protein, partial [Gammaproteobacteria bacterium]|nr:Ig-like domain-containing protein [Gammaproteobacteria bacterium]